MPDLLNLSKKLALITGAANGIGFTTAELFAKHGASLALVDISPKIHEIALEIQSVASDSNQNIKVKGFICDVTKKDEVNKLFQDIKNNFPEYKAANIVVNSAGIAILGGLTNVSEADYDKLTSVNLKGTFLVTQAAIAELLVHHPDTHFKSELETYASIINLSSTCGTARSFPQSSAYAITKAGVIGFTNSLSKEFGKYRIRTNSVLPYTTLTPLVQAALSKEQIDMVSSLTPLGRVAQPIEIANAILFLASDASSYINGSNIEITGGF